MNKKQEIIAAIEELVPDYPEGDHVDPVDLAAAYVAITAIEIINTLIPEGSVLIPKSDIDALKQQVEQRTDIPLSHEACDAFWAYWKENGETHKHGYYESTWGAIRAYFKSAAKTKDQRSTPPRSDK